MNMKEINDLIIWTSYHIKDIPQEYKIKECDNIKLFYTNDILLKENNINYLNKYYGELCTMYYVWKNKKSKYVGFQHYRFYLTHADISLLESNKYSIIYQFGYVGNYYKILKNTGINDFVLYKCVEYISKYLNRNKNEIFNTLINDNNVYELCCNTFICSWDIFNDICNFIFGLLNYLLGDYKDILKIEESIKLYKHMFDYIKDEYKLGIDTSNETDKCWAIFRNDGNRYYIHLIEFILGFYINLKYKDKIYINFNPSNSVEFDSKCKYILLDLNNEDINIDDFIKFYKHNTFCNIYNICIYNYKNTSFDKYIKELGDNKFFYLYKNVKLFDDSDSANAFTLEADKNRIYKCKINEYIDIKSPIDFYKNNNYKIKKII